MRHYMCERCGGVGKQPEGCWDGKEYAAPSGKCDDCKGVGYLGLVETDKTSFFSAIGPKNCHPDPVGKHPYTSQFFTPNRELLGAIVDGGNGTERYFVPAA